MNLTVVGHWGGFPKTNEASSGYLLEKEGTHLLLDCGSAVLSTLQSYIQPKDLDAVILSHYHPDHIADIGVLQHALLIESYMSENIKILPIYGHEKDSAAFSSLTYKNITTGLGYHEREPLHIGPFTIRFLETKHPAPCYAMRIEAGGKSLVYTADTSYFEDLVAFSKDADILLCESNFYKGMDSAAAGHMTSEQAGTLASLARVKKLILTHLPHFGSLNQLKLEAAEQYQGEIILAEKGLSVAI